MLSLIRITSTTREVCCQLILFSALSKEPATLSLEIMALKKEMLNPVSIFLNNINWLQISCWNFSTEFHKLTFCKPLF